MRERPEQRGGLGRGRGTFPQLAAVREFESERRVVLHPFVEDLVPIDHPDRKDDVSDLRARQALPAKPLGECLQVAAANVGEALRAELGQRHSS